MLNDAEFHNLTLLFKIIPIVVIIVVVVTSGSVSFFSVLVPTLIVILRPCNINRASLDIEIEHQLPI